MGVCCVNSLKGFFNLSIFGRTFLLMLIALTIAESIGIALILKRPPIHNRPVSLSEVAQQLSDGGHSFKGPPRFGPPGSEPGRPPDFSVQDPGSSGPGPGAPEKSEVELRIYSAATAPIAPSGIDRVASDVTRKRLAAMLQISPDMLRVYVRKMDGFFSGSRGMNEPDLPEGFVVARQLDDGSWRIIASNQQSFPNEFHKQGLILFAAGVLLLLPLAWLFSLSLSVPIANFSKAAKRLGADSNAPPLPVEGPREMLLAIESFNAMQERLNSLLRERTDMIAAIAHDLRTPLTRLAFRLDDLPSPLNEKVSADIQEMKSMISLALDFIRDRAQTLRRERLDFRLLVESVVDDQIDLGRDVKLTSGPSMTLEGDPLALRRAVMNVVDNAIKYGERARLHLNATQEYCVLDIEDDGPGINEALYERVFEPFFRIEGSRNRDTGGVGLGLAVVRAIIQEHVGDIRLSRRSPRGLRVTIRLPLANIG